MAALGEISNSVGSLQGLEKRGEIAVASGGTTDIWRGTLNNNQVALKAFRIYLPHDLREAKNILSSLAPIWDGLVHENVLPFHGVDTSVFQLALVYGWCDNGNIMQYLESHPEASRPKLVTFPPFYAHFMSSTIFQVAAGRRRASISPHSRGHSRRSKRSE